MNLKKQNKNPVDTPMKVMNPHSVNKDSFEIESSLKQTPIAAPKKVTTGLDDSEFADDLQYIELALQSDGIDEYKDDNDLGYDVEEIDDRDFAKHCKILAEKNDYPARSIKPDPNIKIKHKGSYSDSEDESEEMSEDDSCAYKPEATKLSKEQSNCKDNIKRLEFLVTKVDEN